MLSQEIGIGQFLTERRKAGKEEPFFRLVAAGQKQDGTLTRQYIIDIPEEITFLIHEELHLDYLLFGNSIKKSYYTKTGRKVPVRRGEAIPIGLSE
jgi:hypothetical protein